MWIEVNRKDIAVLATNVAGSLQCMLGQDSDERTGSKLCVLV